MSLVIRAGKVLDPEGGAGSADPPTGRRAQAKAGAWMRRWAGIGGSSPVAPLASRADEAACDMPLPTMFLTTKRKLVTPPGRNPVDLFIPGSKLKSADKSQTDIKCFLIKCTENSVQFLPQTPNLSWNIRKHKKEELFPTDWDERDRKLNAAFVLGSSLAIKDIMQIIGKIWKRSAE